MQRLTLGIVACWLVENTPHQLIRLLQHCITSPMTPAEIDLRAKALFLTAILGFLISAVLVVTYGVWNRTIHYDEN
jgi:hypothetical protein